MYRPELNANPCFCHANATCVLFDPTPAPSAAPTRSPDDPSPAPSPVPTQLPSILPSLAPTAYTVIPPEQCPSEEGAICIDARGKEISPILNSNVRVCVARGRGEGRGRARSSARRSSSRAAAEG